MQCKRCDGLGTITLSPRRNLAAGEEPGRVIALCPACGGSGETTGLRISARNLLRRPSGLRRRIA
jgi:hypothetical protein